MQSIQIEMFEDSPQPSSFGRMSPACSPPKTTPSDASLEPWPEKMLRSSHQGESGRTQVWLLDPRAQSRGGSSTPNISEWPNDAAVCSLWQVLEASAPSRYFLSSTACAGILRRAEKRGKDLPAMLAAALANVATGKADPIQDGMPLIPCCATGDVFHTLRADGFDASEDGTGRGAGAIAVALRGREGGATEGIGDDAAFTLRASTGGGDKPHALVGMQVRRLTPDECAILQGFPKGHTRITWRNKPAEECPDGPQYKGYGNSMCVAVMQWIGARIAKKLEEV